MPNRPKDFDFNFEMLAQLVDSPLGLQEILLPAVRKAYTDFREKEEIKKTLDFSEFYQNKIEELEFRSTPHYTMSIAKNRTTNDSIVAKIKYPFKYKGKTKKNRYINIFIASLSKFPKGLEDENLKKFADNKIFEYLNKHAPIELMDKDLNLYKL